MRYLLNNGGKISGPFTAIEVYELHKAGNLDLNCKIALEDDADAILRDDCVVLGKSNLYKRFSEFRASEDKPLAHLIWRVIDEGRDESKSIKDAVARLRIIETAENDGNTKIKPQRPLYVSLVCIPCVLFWSMQLLYLVFFGYSEFGSLSMGRSSDIFSADIFGPNTYLIEIGFGIISIIKHSRIFVFGRDAMMWCLMDLIAYFLYFVYLFPRIIKHFGNSDSGILLVAAMFAQLAFMVTLTAYVYDLKKFGLIRGDSDVSPFRG